MRVLDPKGTPITDNCRYVWTLNPTTGEVKTLLDPTRKAKRYMFFPAAVMADGRVVALDLLGRDGYDLDITDIKGFQDSGAFVLRDLVCDDQGRARIMEYAREMFAPEFFGALSLKTLAQLPGGFTHSAAEFGVFPPGSGRALFGRVWYRTGDYVPMAGNWPTIDPEFALGRGAYLWTGFRTYFISDNSQWLIAYRPAPPNSRTPALTDQWVGPFRIPDGGRITRMAAAGNDSLWLTTTQGVYFVDCHGVIAKAIDQGMACSTRQWQKQYAKRLAAADWKSALIPLLAAKQWKEAGDLLDATAHDSSVSENPREFSVLQLWQAYLAAAKGDFSTAASQYDSTALSADQRSDYPEEIFARLNELAMLYDAGRWADLIDLAARVNAKFPQTTPQPGSNVLAQYLATAKRKLAATRPSAPRPEN
jgi:hypothetical protein